MHKLSEAEAETTTKCSSDKGTAAASSATLPQTAKYSHSHSRTPSSAPKENMQHGLSTKVALSRLHDEIEKVLLEQERQHDAER